MCTVAFTSHFNTHKFSVGPQPSEQCVQCGEVEDICFTLCAVSRRHMLRGRGFSQMLYEHVSCQTCAGDGNPRPRSSSSELSIPHQAKDLISRPPLTIYHFCTNYKTGGLDVSASSTGVLFRTSKPRCALHHYPFSFPSSLPGTPPLPLLQEPGAHWST